jgi:hypothetical protein
MSSPDIRWAGGAGPRMRTCGGCESSEGGETGEEGENAHSSVSSACPSHPHACRPPTCHMPAGPRAPCLPEVKPGRSNMSLLQDALPAGDLRSCQEATSQEAG